MDKQSHQSLCFLLGTIYEKKAPSQARNGFIHLASHESRFQSIFSLGGPVLPPISVAYTVFGAEPQRLALIPLTHCGFLAAAIYILKVDRLLLSGGYASLELESVPKV